jgi:hypothetical protein
VHCSEKSKNKKKQSPKIGLLFLALLIGVELWLGLSSFKISLLFSPVNLGGALARVFTKVPSFILAEKLKK